MTEKTEARIQQEAFMWHWNTYPTHRKRLFMVNNNPRNEVDGNRMKAQGMIAGVSDMILLREGRPPLCIEFKLPNGRQSPAQVAWQSVAEATGAEYVLIRSLEEFQNLFSPDRTT